MFCSNCGSKMSSTDKFCPSCGKERAEGASKSPLPEGNDLLNGLYLTREYLKKINTSLSKFWELERQYRNELLNFTTDTISGKSEYTLFISGIAFSIVMLIASLLGNNSTNILFTGLITLLFVVGKLKNNKKFYRIGAFALGFITIKALLNIPNSFKMSTAAGLGYVFFLAISYGSAIAISRIVIKKYNSKIDQQNAEIIKHNESLTEERKLLSEHINDLNSKLKAETSSWYPVDYYNLDATNKFISYVKNHEAHTVKEMISIYKEDKYRTTVSNNFNKVKQKIDMSINNQEEMINLQRTSNVLLLGNLVANMTTASNTYYTGQEAKRREEVRRRKNTIGF